MEWQIQIKLNEKLYLRDPEQTELGQRMVVQGINMLDELGYEDFSFKKLGKRLQTTESSIYRYFENKHRLLLYIADWFWRWQEYQLMYHTNNMTNPVEKIDTMLNILFLKVESGVLGFKEMDIHALRQVLIKESSKVYLTSHVQDDNNFKFFKPYKDLCSRIAQIFLEYSPSYAYARSLTSTIMEMSRYQYFFMHNLPALTDFGDAKKEESIMAFLRNIIFSCLDAAKADGDTLEK
jgi:AcrR family transcriptional regulator